MAGHRYGMVAMVSFALGMGAMGFAQDEKAVNTRQLTEGQKPGSATIADAAWMAGHWVGAGLGGVVEEVWSPPRDGVMMGVFRAMKDGKTMFYEIMTIAEEEGSLVLRLKHFHADLKGWEEKDKFVEFKLVAKEGKSLYFSGLTLRQEDDGSMRSWVAVGQKDGAIHEEGFLYQRKASLSP